MTYLFGEPQHVLLNGTIGLPIEINMFRVQISLLTTDDPTLRIVLNISYRANIRALNTTLKTIQSSPIKGRSHYICYLSNDRVRYFDQIVQDYDKKKVVKS